MEAAKEELGLQSIDSQAWTEMLPPGLFAWGMRLLANVRWGDRFRPPINLILSNVRGPTGPLSAFGHPVEEIYSAGPLLGSVGLNITVWSYHDSMFFGLLANPDLTPDLGVLAAAFGEGLAELEAALDLRKPFPAVG